MTTRRFGPAILLTSAVLILGARATAVAQDSKGAGRTEIVAAVFGAGAVFMPAAIPDDPVTNNILVGLTVTRNVTPRVGIEGDLTVALGRDDAHRLYGTVYENQKTPNMLFYGARVVYNPLRSDRRIVPFVQGGLGGLRVFEAHDGVATGFAPNSDHLTASGGGGVRWFVARHYGLRADYQYVFIRNDEAPELAGQLPVQRAHRVAGSLIITF